MSSILASIRDLITTSFKLIGEVFAQVFRSFEGAFRACLGFLTGIVAMIQDVVLGLTKAVGGVTSFIIGRSLQHAHRGGWTANATRRKHCDAGAPGRRGVSVPGVPGRGGSEQASCWAPTHRSEGTVN